MTVDYDVIVVGAGPAGCAAAYDLVAAGQRVALLDRHQFPRTKACAGALTIKSLAALRFSVAPVVREVCFNLVVGLRTETTRTFLSDDPICAMTVRADLDAYVLEQTRARGAAFIQIGKISAIDVEPERVTLRTESGDITGKFLIGADGANSAVARLTQDFPAGYSGFAIECHVDTREHYEMEFDFGVVPFGYGWIFPKRDHLNVGVYTNLPHKGVVTLEGLRKYAQLKTGSSEVRHVVGHPIGLGGPAYRPHSLRTFLVGDAAGLVDPLLGEGIYYAIVSGQTAAAAIAASGGDAKRALDLFKSRIRGLRHDLEVCRDAAEMFYGDVDSRYKLLTTALPRYALMKGFAAGRTFGSIRKRFYTVPFSRPPKLDLPVTSNTRR
ncbi:MAG TPA: geranylgeranyl reductase family protein [Thermoanaerobaculia bacterium]